MPSLFGYTGPTFPGLDPNIGAQIYGQQQIANTNNLAGFNRTAAQGAFGTIPALYQQKRFDTVFPFLTQAALPWLANQINGGNAPFPVGRFMPGSGPSYGSDGRVVQSYHPGSYAPPNFRGTPGTGGGAAAGVAASAGSMFGTQPTINAGPAFDPQMIEQQVNAMRAQNDARNATDIRNSTEQLAGRGFTQNSPLIAALNARYNAANTMANTSGERDIRMNAAQMNAEHLLRGQLGQEQQFATRQQEEIARQAARNHLLQALMGQMFGLTGSLV